MGRKLETIALEYGNFPEGEDYVFKIDCSDDRVDVFSFFPAYMTHPALLTAKIYKKVLEEHATFQTILEFHNWVYDKDGRRGTIAIATLGGYDCRFLFYSPSLDPEVVMKYADIDWTTVLTTTTAFFNVEEFFRKIEEMRPRQKRKVQVYGVEQYTSYWGD